MICLDTDFLINFLNGDRVAIDKLSQLQSDNVDFATTSINTLELYVGIIELEGISGPRVRKTREFIETLPVLNFENTSSERAAFILNNLKKVGKTIGLKDSLIAAIAIENKARVLTRNIKHFERISGLTLETW